MASKYVSEVLVKDRIAHCLYNSNLSSEDEESNTLFDELKKNSLSYVRVHRNPCYYIKLGNSYDEYLEQTKTAKRRRKLRYEERRLFNSGNVAIQYYSGKEITPEVLGRIAKVQEESWMKRRGAATLGHPFYKKLFGEIAKNGFGDLWLMTINEEDAAFVYALVAHRKLHYYRTAFKLQFVSPLSIGKILTMRVIRDACNRDILYFDFGQGDGEYKRFWATDCHDVNRVAVGWGLGGRLVVFCMAFIWRLGKHKWLFETYRRLRRKLKRARIRLSSVSVVIFALGFVLPNSPVGCVA
jgi:CelD/BcsL family acetyltransferase involved in cellulose biosynthesis